MLRPDFFQNRPPTAVNSTTISLPVSRLSPARSPTHIRHALQRNVYGYNPGVKQTCILYTIARPPASSSSAAALERMQLVVNDHRGGSRGAGRPDRRGDAAESPERRCGGGWSRVVKVRRLTAVLAVVDCCYASERRRLRLQLTTRRRPPLRGWSRGR